MQAHSHTNTQDWREPHKSHTHTGLEKPHKSHTRMYRHSLSLSLSDTLMCCFVVLSFVLLCCVLRGCCVLCLAGLCCVVWCCVVLFVCVCLCSIYLGSQNSEHHT